MTEGRASSAAGAVNKCLVMSDGKGKLKVARAGRKAKQGKREPNGRLSRKEKARTVIYDPGSDWSRSKLSVYGTDGSDAIGRAFAMGLLGDHGEALCSVARSIYRAYWPPLCVGPLTSTLGMKSAGRISANDIDPDREARQLYREEALLEDLRIVDRMGHNIRRAFDQLCINPNPDVGPLWLDRLIAAKQRGDDPKTQAADYETLQAALKALRMIAGPLSQGAGIQGGNDGESSLDQWFREEA